jgi:Rha family phage regulatory protein
MYDLNIIKQNGRAYIDSREVAEAIGKRHDHLLRDIDGYLQILDKSNAPNFGGIDFFLKSSYIDARGREKPCYLLSKRGCELTANKLTGEKGVLFTAAYVTKFNEMADAEFEAKAATPRLKVFNAAVRNILGGFTYTHSSPVRVMDFLRGAYEPFGIEVVDRDERNDHTISATDIAALYDVYSETGRPHGHAVAAIIEKLNLAPEHIAVVPYGLVGVAARYDFFTYQAVGEWLAGNNYPRDIPHLDFEYHVSYHRQMSLDDYELDDDDYYPDTED